MIISSGKKETPGHPRKKPLVTRLISSVAEVIPATNPYRRPANTGARINQGNS